MKTYTVTLEVRVHDETDLWDAAMNRATFIDKLPPKEAYSMLTNEGDMDPQACLVMLLDPGTLPGAQILETTCEQAKCGLHFGDDE